MLSDAIPAGYRLLDGRVRVLTIAGLHHPGSLDIEGGRLLLPRQRVRAGVYQPSPAKLPRTNAFTFRS